MMKKIVAILLLVCILIVGCDDSYRQSRYYKHKFKLGQTVQMKLDKHKGVVVQKKYYQDYLQVRFANNNTMTTNTRFLGNDQPITTTPYHLIWVREFELERADE